MALHRLRIENWHPSTLNQLMRHWRTAQRLKRVDRNLICAYCILNRIPVAVGSRMVSLELTYARSGKLPDPDSFWKSTLDALVHAKMLVDDNRHFVRQGTVKIEHGPKRETVIELVDL
jgi:Holliday junction resolvase RusA-like endonuclease